MKIYLLYEWKHDNTDEDTVSVYPFEKRDGAINHICIRADKSREEIIELLDGNAYNDGMVDVTDIINGNTRKYTYYIVESDLF
jgi:hypothetical protein